MAMVGVVSGSLYRRTQPKSYGLVLGRRPLGAILHSSIEPVELSQWLCHDDSIINIVVLIIIIIIYIYIYKEYSIMAAILRGDSVIKQLILDTTNVALCRQGSACFGLK